MFKLANKTLYASFIVLLSICPAMRCMESETGALSGYEGDTETLNTVATKQANRVQPRSPELRVPAIVCAYYAKASRPASTTPTKNTSFQEKDTFHPITTPAAQTISRNKSEESLEKKKIPAITRVMSETSMPSCCKFNIQRRSATASPVASPFAKKTLSDTHDSSDSDSDDNLPDNDYEQSSITENN